VIEFHRTGRLRILAGTSPKRLTAANDLPTAAESLPAMISQQLIGLFAPTGTAKAIISQIAQANHTLLAESGYQMMLVETGFSAGRRFVTADIPRSHRGGNRQMDADRAGARN